MVCELHIILAKGITGDLWARSHPEKKNSLKCNEYQWIDRHAIWKNCLPSISPHPMCFNNGAKYSEQKPSIFYDINGLLKIQN